VVPVEFGVREQSAFGRASERHLVSRLSRMNEAKFLEELERQEAEKKQARSFYDDDDDDAASMSGLAAPDPTPRADCQEG